MMSAFFINSSAIERREIDCLYSSPKGELANQIAQINADLLGLLGLSTIECRGWHKNEQAKVGSKGERLGEGVNVLPKYQ